MNCLKDARYYQVLGDWIAKALEKYPDDRDKIRRGADLILKEHVARQPNGYALVRSLDGERTYAVNSTCSCLAFVHGTHRCSHRYAATLVRRTEEQLELERQPLAVAPPEQSGPYPHSVEMRDTLAAQGNLVALACNGRIGTVQDWHGVEHAVGGRGRNGGQFEPTAGR